MTGRRLLVMIWLVACSREAPVTQGAPASAAEVVDGPEAAAKRPLQRWMSDELMFRLRAKDLPGVAKALDVLAEVAPPGYPRWHEIAAAAAGAAAAGDLEAVRRGCASCHQRYRARFRLGAESHASAPLLERRR